MLVQAGWHAFCTTICTRHPGQHPDHLRCPYRLTGREVTARRVICAVAAGIADNRPRRPSDSLAATEVGDGSEGDGRTGR